MLSSQVFRMYWLLIVYLKKKQLKSIRHNQIKYVLWALFFYTFAAADFATNYGIPQYPLGFFPIIISFAIISYSIVAHRLMDIAIVIRKTIVYSLLASSIAVIFTLTTVFFEHIFKQTIGYKTFSGTLIVAFLIAFFFQPLYRWLSSIADKLFFKGTLPQIAEELQRSEKLASLGILASGLAHEIKNPLAPIKTYIQNLPKNLNNPDFINKVTKIIPDEVDKITDIINQLRDFANPPSLTLYRVNIHDLIDKRLNLLEQDLSAKNIAVEKFYSPALPEINADSIQLERVFLNLFLNAIDAMPNGGMLTITTEQSNKQVLIKVSDTGIGIAKEDLPHIFDPFYSKGKHKGTGLGLAVTHQIVEAHNGVINVESYPNKGTTFSITL